MPVLAGKIINGDVVRADFLQSMGVFKVASSSIPILEVEGAIRCLMEEVHASGVVRGQEEEESSFRVIKACLMYFAKHARDVQATVGLREYSRQVYHPQYNFRELKSMMYNAQKPIYKFIYDSMFSRYGVLKMTPAQVSEFDLISEYRATLPPKLTMEERIADYVVNVSSLMRKVLDRPSHDRLGKYLDDNEDTGYREALLIRLADKLVLVNEEGKSQGASKQVLKMKEDAPAPLFPDSTDSDDQDLTHLDAALPDSSVELQKLRSLCPSRGEQQTFEGLLQGFLDQQLGIPRAALVSLLEDLGFTEVGEEDFDVYVKVLFALVSDNSTKTVCMRMTRDAASAGQDFLAGADTSAQRCVLLGDSESGGRGTGSLKDVKIKDKKLRNLMKKVATGELDSLNELKGKVESMLLFRILQDSTGPRAKYSAAQAVNQVAKCLELLHKGLEIALNSEAIDDKYVTEMRGGLSGVVGAIDDGPGMTLLTVALSHLEKAASEPALKTARNLMFMLKALKLDLWPSSSGMNNNPLVRVLHLKLDMMEGKVENQARLIDLLLKKDSGLDMSSDTVNQDLYLKALLVLYNHATKGGEKPIHERARTLWFGDEDGQYYPLLNPGVLIQESSVGKVCFLHLFAYSGDFYSLFRSMRMLVEVDTDFVQAKANLGALESKDELSDVGVTADLTTAKTQFGEALTAAMRKVLDLVDQNSYTILHYLSCGGQFHLLFKPEYKDIIKSLLGEDLATSFFASVKAKLIDNNSTVSLAPGDEYAPSVNLLQFVELTSPKTSITRTSTFKGVSAWLREEGVELSSCVPHAVAGSRSDALEKIETYSKVILGGLGLLVVGKLANWDSLVNDSFPVKGKSGYDVFSLLLLKKLESLKIDAHSQQDFAQVKLPVFLSSYSRNFLTKGYGPYVWHGEGEVASKFKDKSINMLLPDSVLFGTGYLPAEFSTSDTQKMSFWHLAAVSCDVVLMSRAVKKAAAEGKLGELLTYEAGYKASFLHYLFTSTKVNVKDVSGFLYALADAIDGSVLLSKGGIDIDTDLSGDGEALLRKQTSPIFGGDSPLEDIVKFFVGAECTRHLSGTPVKRAPVLLHYILARKEMYSWKAAKVALGESKPKTSDKDVLYAFTWLMKVVAVNSGLTIEQIDSVLGNIQTEFDRLKEVWNNNGFDTLYGTWSRDTFDQGMLFDTDRTISGFFDEEAISTESGSN